jgi:hypothetical protein
MFSVRVGPSVCWAASVSFVHADIINSAATKTEVFFMFAKKHFEFFAIFCSFFLINIIVQ